MGGCGGGQHTAWGKGRAPQSVHQPRQTGALLAFPCPPPNHRCRHQLTLQTLGIPEKPDNVGKVSVSKKWRKLRRDLLPNTICHLPVDKQLCDLFATTICHLHVDKYILRGSGFAPSIARQKGTPLPPRKYRARRPVHRLYQVGHSGQGAMNDRIKRKAARVMMSRQVCTGPRCSNSTQIIRQERRKARKAYSRGKRVKMSRKFWDKETFQGENIKLNNRSPLKRTAVTRPTRMKYMHVA